MYVPRNKCSPDMVKDQMKIEMLAIKGLKERYSLSKHFANKSIKVADRQAFIDLSTKNKTVWDCNINYDTQTAFIIPRVKNEASSDAKQVWDED